MRYGALLTPMGRTLPLAARSTDAWDRPDCPHSPTALLEACTSPQRRVVVETLCDVGSLTLDALAERVVAGQREVSRGDVREDAVEQTTVGLYHNHLQQLADAGIVDLADSGRDTTVALTPDLEPEYVRELIEAGGGDWNALQAILNDERGQYATRVLSNADGPLSIDELAEAVAFLERGEPECTNGEFLESVRISLHHVHLPRLGEAGVTSYDDEGGRVELDRVPGAFEAIVGDDSGALSA